jgi:pimeloyl-ACP methyl ester carboxylesterase
MTDFGFVHGGGQGSWVWNETIAALALQSGGAARCLALDVPGCGTKRGVDTSATAFDDIVTALIDDVVVAGMRDVVLVGHSQAGMVLPRMAQLRPDLFAALVYVSCSGPPPGMTTIERMGDSLNGEREDQVGWPIDPKASTMEERFRVMFCNDMAPAGADAFLAKLGSDMWPVSSYTHRDWQYDHLGAIASTFVLCLRDNSLPPPWQEKFAAAFKVDEIVRVDAGHQVMNTRPHALAEILLAQRSG